MKMLLVMGTLLLTGATVLINPAEVHAQRCRNTEVSRGEYRRGTVFSTSDGNTRLSFQDDGNLVLFRRDQVLWATGTERRGNFLAFQSDGNLVIYDFNNRPIWNSRSSGNPGASLRVQCDSNLVIYNANGAVVFASGTDGGRRQSTNNVTTPRQATWQFPWRSGSYPVNWDRGWHTDDYRRESLDFLVPAGVEIVAPTDSKVVHFCNAGNNHMAILFESNDGQRFSMIHIRARGIFKGQTFRQGDLIGVVASDRPNNDCARSTGAHLHFGFPSLPFEMGGQTFSR